MKYNIDDNVLSTSQKGQSPSPGSSYRSLSTASPNTKTRSTSTLGTSRPEQITCPSYLGAPHWAKKSDEFVQIPFGSATSDSLWDSKLILSNSTIEPLAFSASYKSSANLSCFDHDMANFSSSSLQKQITTSTAESVHSRFGTSLDGTASVDPTASCGRSDIIESPQMFNASSYSVRNESLKGHVSSISSSEFLANQMSPLSTSNHSGAHTSARSHFLLNSSPKTQTGIPKPTRSLLRSARCEDAGGSFLNSSHLSERNTPSHVGHLHRQSPSNLQTSSHLSSRINRYGYEELPEYKISPLSSSSLRSQSPLTAQTSSAPFHRAASVDIGRSASVESQKAYSYDMSTSGSRAASLQRRPSPYQARSLGLANLSGSRGLNSSHEVHSDSLSRAGQQLNSSLSRSRDMDVHTERGAASLYKLKSAPIVNMSASASSSKSSSSHPQPPAFGLTKRVVSDTGATVANRASTRNKVNESNLDPLRESGLRQKREDWRSGQLERSQQRMNGIEGSNSISTSDEMMEGLLAAKHSFPITGSNAWPAKGSTNDDRITSATAKHAASMRDRTPRVESYLEFLKQLHADKKMIPPDSVGACLVTLASHSSGLPCSQRGGMPWCCVADFELKCEKSSFGLSLNSNPLVCVKDQVVITLLDTLLRGALLLSVQEQDLQHAFTSARTSCADNEKAPPPCEAVVSLSLKATAEEGVVMSLAPIEGLPRKWEERLLPLSSCSMLLLCLAALEGPCGGTSSSGCSSVHVSYSRVVFALQQEMSLRSSEAEPFDVCAAFTARGVFPWGPLVNPSLLPASDAVEGWICFNYDISALMLLALAVRTVEPVTANKILLKISKHILSCSPMGLIAWFSAAALMQLDARDHPELFAQTVKALEAETKRLPLGAPLADLLWSLIICGLPLKNTFEQAAPAIATSISLFCPEDLCLIACCYALYVCNPNIHADRADVTKPTATHAGSNGRDIAREAPFCFLTRKPRLKAYCLLCTTKMADSGPSPSLSSAISVDTPFPKATPRALLLQLIDHGTKIIQGLSSDACRMLEFCKTKAKEATEKPEATREVIKPPRNTASAHLQTQGESTDPAAAGHTTHSTLELADRCVGQSERGILRQESPSVKTVVNSKVKNQTPSINNKSSGTKNWRFTVTTKVVSLLRKLQPSRLPKSCNTRRKVPQITTPEGGAALCSASASPTLERTASHATFSSDINSRTYSEEDFEDPLHDDDIGNCESPRWEDEPMQDEYDGNYSDVFPSARTRQLEKSALSSESMTVPCRNGFVRFVFDCGAFIAHACMGYLCIMIALCAFSLWREG